MQQDEQQGPQGPGPQGPGPQGGIGSLGPQPMEQQMPMPNRMGAEYGGRIGYQGGEMVEKIKEGIIAGGDRAMGIPGIDESALMKEVQLLMEVLGLSEREAMARVIPQFRKPLSPSEDIRQPQEFSRELLPPPRSLLGMRPQPVEDIREGQIGIETIGRRR